MFDVGLAELAVIAFVAVVLVGPDKLPDLARQAGRLLRRLRAMATVARDDLRRELGPDYADLELRDMDPRTIVRRHVLEAMQEDEPDPVRRPGHRPLAEGELPPYDAEAT